MWRLKFGNMEKNNLKISNSIKNLELGVGPNMCWANQEENPVVAVYPENYSGIFDTKLCMYVCMYVWAKLTKISLTTGL